MIAEVWGSMAKKRKVALFGDTLLMDSVEASLSSQQELGLVRINTQVSNVVDHLRKLGPDLIIFDGDDPQSKFVVPFLQVQSSIPLLCLNGSRNTVVALTAQHFTAQSASDLTRTIQGRVLAAAAP